MCTARLLTVCHSIRILIGGMPKYWGFADPLRKKTPPSEGIPPSEGRPPPQNADPPKKSDRMTHTSENLTLHQNLHAGVNK